MTSRHRHRRLLAAPMLGERGGGVGQVSELLWRSIRDTWDDGADVVTLLRNGHLQPATSDKLRFGAELARRQVWARPEWILFSHVGLARVERFMPDAWRTPYAVFLHGMECWHPLPRQDRDILRRATLRIANSRFTARRAADANPGIGDIAVCPLALPDFPRPDASPDADRDRSDRTVLVVGRLASSERYKGHEQLIRAWPGVAARAPGARLVIAGDGDDAPRLRQIAAGLPAAELVQFTGYLTRGQLAAQYGRATVFALPSRGEGFGLVYLEAMAHGLACIGSMHDAASEVIVDGETGVLVDPDDLDAMGRAICELLEQPERARALGAAGRVRLLDHYTYERFREQVTDLLRAAFEDGSRVEPS